MKTTIDVSDALFDAAKELAQQRQTTLRALVEEGLRRVLDEASDRKLPAFKLRDARVRGRKLLEPDARRWQQMEEDHVIQRAMQPLA